MLLTQFFLVVLSLLKEFPDVGLRLADILVEDLGTVHDLGLPEMQQCTNVKLTIVTVALICFLETTSGIILICVDKLTKITCRNEAR